MWPASYDWHFGRVTPSVCPPACAERHSDSRKDSRFLAQFAGAASRRLRARTCGREGRKLPNDCLRRLPNAVRRRPHSGRVLPRHRLQRGRPRGIKKMVRHAPALREFGYLLRVLPVLSLSKHSTGLQSCARNGIHAPPGPGFADKLCSGLGREGLPHPKRPLIGGKKTAATPSAYVASGKRTARPYASLATEGNMALGSSMRFSLRILRKHWKLTFIAIFSLAIAMAAGAVG